MKPFVKLSQSKEILLDFFLVFLFATVLILPYFTSKYVDRWDSIESTFIADARFLIAHWPHPQWQPLWYTGTRFDYVYPPALRYGTAIIAKTTGFLPVQAYHFYVAFFYSIGIAAVYLLVRIGSGSRRTGYLAAIATSLMSPVFLVLAPYRHGSWMHQPQRLWVLNRYGEGPHITALALLPIALAFCWLALEKRRHWAVALAGIFAAVVVSNNFYGATALAIFYPLLVWSFWITRQNRQMVAPAIAIPVLAYGLTAFWLVPSYLKVTTANMKYVSLPGNAGSAWVMAAAALAFVMFTGTVARGKPGRTWHVFVLGSVVFFSLNVLGNYYFNFRITGEPHRLVPELDMMYVIAGVSVLRWLWNRPGTTPRILAAAVMLAAFSTARGYVQHAWQAFPQAPDYRNRIEYKISDWMWRNMPDARALPIGSVRFWYDVWHDLVEVGGGSDQGLLNPLAAAGQWVATQTPDAESTILWMQALGCDAIYVSNMQSQEEYKDFKYPLKFAGVLPILYDNHQGDMIFRVPRRYLARARVVQTAKLNAVQGTGSTISPDRLRAYVDAIENGSDSPATLKHVGPDVMEVHATIAAGQSIIVQETYDLAWHAWSDGKRVPVHKDAMNMMMLDVPPGDRDITLAFITPLENQLGRVLAALTLVVILTLLWSGWRSERHRKKQGLSEPINRGTP